MAAHSAKDSSCQTGPLAPVDLVSTKLVNAALTQFNALSVPRLICVVRNARGVLKCVFSQPPPVFVNRHSVILRLAFARRERVFFLAIPSQR